MRVLDALLLDLEGLVTFVKLLVELVSQVGSDVLGVLNFLGLSMLVELQVGDESLSKKCWSGRQKSLVKRGWQTGCRTRGHGAA